MVVVVHKDPSAQPRYLSHQQSLGHSLQTPCVAFPAFPTNLEAFRDGYGAVPEQALPVSLPSPRGFLSLLLELAQIGAVPSVGFALGYPMLREAEVY